MTTAPATRVLVVGAGGHAVVCLEALRDSGFVVVGCVNRDGSRAPALTCPMLGLDTDLEGIAGREQLQHVFVAIGDNAARQAVTERCVRAGLSPVNAISRFAMVSPAATVGAGVAILAGAVVNPSAEVADGAIVNTRASIDHDVRVGRFAHVAVGVSLAGGVTVGDRALLGVGSCAIPQVVIGADAIVGAGAAVVADVTPGVTVVGIPARERPAG